AHHLNAVSLRAGPGRFEMEEKRVNGELMLQVNRLAIDGIDFAPDSPAMATYGIEVLAAEARVEAPTPAEPESTKPSPKRRTRTRMTEELTLETLPRERPDLIQELETPHKK